MPSIKNRKKMIPSPPYHMSPDSRTELSYHLSRHSTSLSFTDKLHMMGRVGVVA